MVSVILLDCKVYSNTIADIQTEVPVTIHDSRYIFRCLRSISVFHHELLVLHSGSNTV